MTLTPTLTRCVTCGDSLAQHQPPADEPGSPCWGRVCITRPAGARCTAYAAAGPPVDRAVVAIGQRAPQTSKDAAAAALPRAGTLRSAVYGAIAAAGTRGCTDDDLEVILDRTHQATSASRNTLMRDGLIADSGHRRPTRHGHPATVWVTLAHVAAGQVSA